MVRFSCQSCGVGVLSAPNRRSFTRSACHALATMSDIVVIISNTGNIRARAQGLVRIYHVEGAPMVVFIGGVSHRNGSPFSLLSRLRRRLVVRMHPLS